MNDKDAKALIDEVRALKMLAVLQLLQQGVKQKQIASILGVSEATVSRMLPRASPKSIKDSVISREQPSAGEE